MYVSFCVWLSLLSRILSGFNNVLECHSLLRLDIIPLHVDTILFIHSLVSGHLRCFYHLTIVSKAAVNTGAHVCVQASAF